MLRMRPGHFLFLGIMGFMVVDRFDPLPKLGKNSEAEKLA
jgi:hypothetical protein